MIMSDLGGLIVVVLSALGIAGLSLLARRWRRPALLRPVEAFDFIARQIGYAVETGSRLHLSLGPGPVHTAVSPAALAGLSLLDGLAEATLASDKPPMVTSGDASTAFLGQDVLRGVYTRLNAPERYDPRQVRLTGLTPFSFAAGTMTSLRDEGISADLLLGSFGAEAALIADAAHRLETPVVGGSNEPQVQALLYAAADYPLVGEELFAARAYVRPSTSHVASVKMQDLLRWAIIAAISAGVVLKTLRVLP